MRNPILRIAGLLVVLVVSLTLAGHPDAAIGAGRPNIILVMTDDLDERSMKNFPGIRRMVGSNGRGATFDNAFVTTSLCCPSRASLLTGMYAHNHLVRGNRPPEGSLERFRKEGHERTNVARRLDSNGYRTVMIGKYLNGYHGDYVPPYWDKWYGYKGHYRKPPHVFNENGKLRSYNRLDTYVMRDKAVSEIRATPNSKPLFMWLSFNAPHLPNLYPSKYEELFLGYKVPRVPSIGENVSDKPHWVQEHSGHPPADGMYRNRLRATRAVANSLSKVLNALSKTGKLSNTYIVFTSDNGYRMGEHGLKPGKRTAYEEDVSVPLYVRGPGITPGRRLQKMALNIDLAPTFVDWANAGTLGYADGRSLAPLLNGSGSSRRTAFLIEGWRDRNSDAPHIPTYSAIRKSGYIYVKYKTGAHEFYDLRDDPYQLQNKYHTVDPAFLASLQERLAALKRCAGDGCRKAENGL